MVISKDSTSQLASTKDSSAIDVPSIKLDSVIKRVSNNDGEVDKVDIIDINCMKISKSIKSKNLIQPKEGKAGFLTYRARLAFTILRLAFIKAFSLYYFDSECYIWIETDISDNAIGRVLSQLITKGLSW